MGREIRIVPENWQHPKDENGLFIPLFGRCFSKSLRRWNFREKKWNQGLRIDNNGSYIQKEKEYENIPYSDFAGKKPLKSEYMPEWKKSELTHIQLYENTSEGTPITPVFKKDDLMSLCEYAANNCTVFGNLKYSKEELFNFLKNQ